MQDVSTEPRWAAVGLATEQRFLLWAIRAWVVFFRAKTLPAEPVDRAFAQAGSVGAARALDDAMRAMARGALRPLDVHGPHCPGFTADERRLLTAVAAAQHGNDRAARAQLGVMLRPTFVDAALGGLRRLGALMIDAGLFLPDPGDDEAAGRAGRSAPAGATLH